MPAIAPVPATTATTPVRPPASSSTGSDAFSCGALVSSILNTPLQSPDAGPLSIAAGAGIGALMSCLAQCWNASASLHAGAAVGAALGSVSLQISRCAHSREDAHRLRWEFLQSHRGTRRLLQDNSVTFEQRAAVCHVYDHLQARLAELLAGFRAHCGERGVHCDALVEKVLAHFYVAHCAEHIPVVVSRLAENRYFIGAIKQDIADAVRARMNEAKDPAMVFASENAMHMVLELQADAGFRARVFEPVPCERHDAARGRSAQCRGPLPTTAQPRSRQAAASLPDCRPQPLVELRRRNPGRRSAEAVRDAVPDVAQDRRKPGTSARPVVVVGKVLRQQRAHLAEWSRTLSDIDSIVEDLAQGRTTGHSVTVGGERYIARDIHLDGLSGRNRWRLLHRRVATGYELVGIADYHTDAQPARWWNL